MFSLGEIISIGKDMDFFINSLYQRVKLFAKIWAPLLIKIIIENTRVKDVFFNKIMHNFVLENHSYPTL